MPGGIQVLALGAHPLMIQLGEEQRFLAHHRLHQPFPIRPGDTGAAVCQYIRAIRQDQVQVGCARREIRPAHQAGDRKHKGARFFGNEAGDVFGIAPVAGPDRHMQILALPIQRSARQRQPVLPAVQAAESESAQAVDAQPMPVADSPGQALFIGGHELAVYGLDGAPRIDVHQRSVQAVPAAVGGALDDAQVDRDPALRGNLAQRPQMPGFDLQRLIQVVGVDLFLNGGVEAGPIGQLDPERVAGHERLAKGDQPAARIRRTGHVAADLRQRAGAVQPDRRDLGQADFEEVGIVSILQGFHTLFPPVPILHYNREIMSCAVQFFGFHANWPLPPA